MNENTKDTKGAPDAAGDAAKGAAKAGQEGKPTAKPPAKAVKKAQPPASADKAAHPGRTAGALMGLLAVLALAVGLGAAGGVWYVWTTQDAAVEKARAERSSLDTRIAQVAQLGEDIQRLGTAQTSAASERAALAETQEHLQGDLSALLERSTHLRNDWLVAEAEYLIKLANHRLLLDRDVKTALSALGTADERLREAGDPALIPARRALASDMAALRAVPKPDISGISLTLGALGESIDTLPLSTPDP
ncbi:MAG: uroporphyrinogen-III C-methyltransferase, partial [Pseudomonadota bacterium]